MIQYIANGGPWQQGITLASFAQRAQTQGGGPTPLMGGEGPITTLDEGERGVINFGPNGNRLMALGLLTCAAVILASTDPTALARAAVFHAPSGSIPAGTLDGMRGSLGNPTKNSLLAAYVVAKPWDANYNADALTIENWGVPPNRVTYMANLRASQFGIDAQGQIGV